MFRRYRWHCVRLLLNSSGGETSATQYPIWLLKSNICQAGQGSPRRAGTEHQLPVWTNGRRFCRCRFGVGCLVCGSWPGNMERCRTPAGYLIFKCCHVWAVHCSELALDLCYWTCGTRAKRLAPAVTNSTRSVNNPLDTPLAKSLFPNHHVWKGAAIFQNFFL